MYAPRHFDETRLEVLHGLIHDHPLGALVTRDELGGLCADHLPFELAAATPEAPFGILRGHVARANPLWRHGPAGGESLVIFQGPQAYISPAWYEEKALTGKVVPTYNYAVVHAHGPLRAVEDADWILAVLERLTQRHEAGQPAPWQVADAPRAYVDKLLAAVVGIEIPLSRLQGKWKACQNESAPNQARVAAGLRAGGTADGRAMAALMESKPGRLG